MSDTSKSPATLPENPPATPSAPIRKVAEHGGPKGPEPTRYGDWEINGKCVDF